MTSSSPLIRLPGELRNSIFEFIALDATEIRLHEGRVVLPPLACTCRQLRKEMSGKYEAEVVLDQRLPIEAHFTSFNFAPLYRWLDANDHRQEGQEAFFRKLDIILTLVSPPVGTSSSTDEGDRIAHDRQALLSCDGEWRNKLDDGLIPLMRREYEITQDWNWKNDPRLVDRLGNLRGFTQTKNGCCYLISCETRIKYLHHPALDKEGNDAMPCGGFVCVHDYQVRLQKQIADDVKTLYPTSPPAFNSAKFLLDVVRRSLAVCARRSRKLEWDEVYYQILTRPQQKVVWFYRRRNRILPVQNLKRSAEVYAQDGEMEDGASSGRQKRRFISGSQDYEHSLEGTGIGRVSVLMEGIVFEEDNFTEKLCEIVESMDRLRLGD